MLNKLKFPIHQSFGRKVSNTKIFQNLNLTTKQKDTFKKEIKKIVHTSIISPEILNIAAHDQFEEITVLTLELEDLKVNLDLLKIIDRAMPRPIIFILRFETKLCYAASYKHPQNNWQTTNYYFSDWINDQSEEINLPLALNIKLMYEALIQLLIPISKRENEIFLDFLDRVEKIKKFQKETEKLAKRLRQEKQFNRKVELNKKLKDLKQKVENLTA